MTISSDRMAGRPPSAFLGADKAHSPVLWLDIETYCEADLRETGVYAYANHPSFEILMVAWAMGSEKVTIATGDEVLDIPRLTDPDTIKIAHNAQFERVCFSAALGLPEGEFLDPSEWYDTMAVAAVQGLPRSLAKLAEYLDVDQKDSAGTSLINTFSKLRRSKRVLPEDEPVKWQAFKDYCIQDVRVMRQIAAQLDPMDQREWDIYHLDQKINDRGIATDTEMAQAATLADQANREVAGERMRELLGIENPASVQQLKEGFSRLGLDLPDLRSATIDAKLAKAEGDIREALLLRKELALVAAKKYQSMLNASGKDGRLRGEFRYFGAHTGRWSSRGVQIQNLPRAEMEADPRLAILDLKLGMPTSSNDLKALVRQAFVGPFTVLDYASIEARVLAWVAGERWVLDAFESGRDIYVETAKRMSSADRELTRQQGKVAVLALGYKGGPNALAHMGAEGSSQELVDLVSRWRKANPRIRSLWARLEDAFRSGGTAGMLEVVRDGKDRSLLLPSGRAITYRKVSWRDGLSYDNPTRGGRVDTYGGRLTENAVQAISRDLLAEAMLRLDASGMRVVGHIHDEVIIEGEVSIQEASDLMCRDYPWAEGLPLSAEGFTTYRYKKG